MFSNLFIALSLGAAFLAVLELLLDERQKRSILDRITPIWNHLDETKQALRARIQEFLKELQTARPSEGDVFYISSRLLGFSFLFFTPIAIGVLIWYPIGEASFIIAVTVGTVLLVAAVLFGYLFVCLLGMAIGLLVLAFIVISVLVAVTWTIELVVRRTVEYPKGPLIAAGILFAALAAVLKSIG